MKKKWLRSCGRVVWERVMCFKAFKNWFYHPKTKGYVPLKHWRDQIKKNGCQTPVVYRRQNSKRQTFIELLCDQELYNDPVINFPLSEWWMMSSRFLLKMSFTQPYSYYCWIVEKRLFLLPYYILPLLSGWRPRWVNDQ